MYTRWLLIIFLAMAPLSTLLAAGASPQYDTLDMKLMVTGRPPIEKSFQWYYRHGRMPNPFVFTYGIMPVELSPCFKPGQALPTWFPNGTAIKIVVRLALDTQGNFIPVDHSWFSMSGDYYSAIVERVTQIAQTL
jgi:hypothetical protein